MKAGSSTKIVHNSSFGFHARQSCQRTRSQTPPKQASPLRVVGRERTDILCDASCGQDCHSYRLRQSVSKIGRRNPRKMTKMLNCSLAARQRATTHRFGHSSEIRRVWLIPGCPSTVLTRLCSIRLPFAPFFEATPMREKIRQI